MKDVDVRGLSCPIPLMHTKKALESNPAELLVLADSGTAKANVVNLLVDMGYSVDVADDGNEYRISAKKA